MSKKYRSNTISVEVDCIDVLEEIDDETLLDEVRHRKLALTDSGTSEIEMVRDAYEELLRGRPAEARSILDRLLNPKWPTVDACLKAKASHA